jgi:hypothetical protein
MGRLRMVWLRDFGSPNDRDATSSDCYGSCDALQEHLDLALGPPSQKNRAAQGSATGSRRMLYEAKERRNALAHLFFRPQEIDDSSARTIMIATQELQDAASFFRHVSTRLDSVMYELLDKLHMSRAQVEIRLEQLRGENPLDRSTGR